jgi:hypothetical protein
MLESLGGGRFKELEGGGKVSTEMVGEYAQRAQQFISAWEFCQMNRKLGEKEIEREHSEMASTHTEKRRTGIMIGMDKRRLIYMRCQQAISPFVGIECVI